jgi:hypothetical protein
MCLRQLLDTNSGVRVAKGDGERRSGCNLKGGPGRNAPVPALCFPLIGCGRHARRTI